MSEKEDRLARDREEIAARVARFKATSKNSNASVRNITRRPWAMRGADITGRHFGRKAKL